MGRRTVQMTQRESLVLALTKYHGYKVDVAASQRSAGRWKVLVPYTTPKANLCRYFIGERGALRYGADFASSKPANHNEKIRLLREGGYWDHLTKLPSGGAHSGRFSASTLNLSNRPKALEEA